MTGNQLKNTILQEAIEGRLVPQDPNEEPASLLLDKIRKEKAKLVKEGKLKKKDLEKTPISEDEIPFNIPESWEWCRLNDICIFLSRGKSPIYSDIPNDYPVFAQKCNLKDGGISLEQARFLSPETVSKWQEEYHLRTGDVLVNSTGTGTVCRTRLFHESCLGNYPFTVPDSHVSVVRTSESICSEYIFNLFNSKTYQDYWEDRLAGSTNQKELYIGVLQNTIIPLPSLAEQRRIVAKIEELLPKVEEYGNAQESLDKLNEELPERLKKSILQEAIEGRLVPQDPNDEPASVLLDKIRKEKARLVKEGKLKKKDHEETPVEENEIPFKIPESWEWVRHNDLFDISGGSQPPKSDFSLEEKEGYIRLYQIRDYGEKPSPVYIPISKASKITQKGDILLARYGGSLGKVFIAEDGAYNVAMAKVEYLFNKSLIDHDYLYYYYNCSLYQDLVKGNNRSAQGGFNKEDLGSLLFPLPPLAEQKRIVAKIEQLMKEIDKLKV